jgi:hypothetical protein
VDNYERRLKYIEANYGLDPAAAALRLQEATLAGTEDSLLKRGQRRRLRQKRGGGHRNDSPPARKGPPAPIVIIDEAQLMSPVVIDGTRISDLARLAAGAPWALPGADVKGDIQQAFEGGSAWDRRDG